MKNKNINPPADFLSYLESGSLKIYSGNVNSINFEANKDTRIIDIMDLPIKISKKPGLIKQLTEAKDLARRLKQQNVTLEIRLQGDTILKLGKNANPKLAKIVTLSGDIEIRDLKKLKKLSSMI